MPRHHTRIALALSTALAAGVLSTAHAGVAHAAPAQIWSQWVAAPGVAGDNIQTIMSSRLLTAADVGKTIQLRVTPSGAALLDCPSAQLQFRSAATGAFVNVAFDAHASGCWVHGVNLVTTVTNDMVGASLSLHVDAVPADGQTRAVLTGQATIGSEQATSSTAVTFGTAGGTAPGTPTGGLVDRFGVVGAPDDPHWAPALFPSSGGADLAALPRVNWAGGSAYYAQFPDAVRAGWSQNTFFPVMLWDGHPDSDAQVQNAKALGVNTYLNFSPETDLTYLQRAGLSYMFRASDGGKLASVARNAPGWVGDYLDDEASGPGDATGISTMDARVAALPDHNKIRFANYDGTVYSWLSASNQPHPANATKLVNGYTDMVSSDGYWWSGNQCDWPDPHGYAYFHAFTGNCRSAQAYGRNQDGLDYEDSLDGKRQPTGTYVENADVAPNGNHYYYVTPQQVKGTAMNTLIHGAAFLVWFNQSFAADCASGSGQSSGDLVTQYLIDPNYKCAAQIKAMGEVNNQVQRLAPVLNTQSIAWNFGPGVQTMFKNANGSSYIFAMPDDEGPNAGAGSKVFHVPDALKGKSVTVVDENRTIAIDANGNFSDGFADINAYHIYKID